MFVLSTTGDRAIVPMALSQKATQLLYKTQTNLGRELFAALLYQLCQQYEDVRREVVSWLIESPDEVVYMRSQHVHQRWLTSCLQRKFNVPVTMTLIRANLVQLPQQDEQMTKMLYSDGRASLQDFAASLIRECLSATPAIASQKSFEKTLRTLSQLSAAGRATEE
jgi:CCR4-NOT transcription complex subunit 1